MLTACAVYCALGSVRDAASDDRPGRDFQRRPRLAATITLMQLLRGSDCGKLVGDMQGHRRHLEERRGTDQENDEVP